MGQKIVIKNRLQKISILFDENDENASARRDILSWYVKSLKQNKIIGVFDFKTIGYWLLDHNQSFIHEFTNSQARPSYHLHSKRTFILYRLNELIELGLLEERGNAPSEKNQLDKKTYAFTKEGCIFAWLIEAKYAENNNRRSVAIESLFRELSSYVIESDSSFTDCFVKYVNQCIEQGAFAEVDAEYIDDIIKLFPITQNYFRFFRLQFLYGLYSDQQFSRIFLKIVEESDEESQSLMLLQLKLDIESNYYDGMGTSKEWEKERYDSIQDHDVVTLQGYCLECKRLWPYRMNIFEFLKLGTKPKTYAPDGGILITSKLICPNCNRPDCRFVVPVWYVPTGFTKPVTSIEYMERAYDIIQTKGNIIDPSTQISDETQKIM
jgi:hypothetical protein